MAKTKKNLKEAFAGESQANRRYLAFSIQAEEEGYPEMAKLFRAIAEAETVHALNHLRVLGEVDSTKSNVKKAIEGEGEEIDEMYPGFIKEAEKEENDRAKTTFNHALSVEKIHKKLLKEALKLVKQGKDIEKEKIMLCPVCGNTMKGEEIIDPCPICATARSEFEEIK
jgi:rubrerythrin